MHFQTFSIVVGTRACNAQCPFCISKQTGLLGTPAKVNWRNFNVACKLAQKSNTTTVLLTGKGEPTLYPDQIDSYLHELQPYGFPLIELQTNGMTIADFTLTEERLKNWYYKGMTTIALSNVHWLGSKNKEIYAPTRPEGYVNPELMVKRLHDIGFSVRFCVMLCKGYVDSAYKFKELIQWCQTFGVEQLTVRNIVTPKVTASDPASQWTAAHALSQDEMDSINGYVKSNGTLLHHLMHGSDIYDVNGQNVCMATSLTNDAEDRHDFRQLIFLPEGSLHWDWQYKGARIL